MTTRPTLELLATGPSTAPLLALVRDLSAWCEPIAGRPWPRTEPPAARLLTSPALSSAGSDPACPTAVWHAEQGAVVIAGRDRPPTTVAVPAQPVDVASMPAVMPFVRARRRAANGQPAELVLPASAFAGDAEAIIASLRIASAAVVPHDWLAIALALATPVVTDAASAAALGARHDVHVVVADDTATASREAAALAGDPRRAARLARAGRALVEQLDRRTVAGKVADALGLVDRGAPDPIARLRSRLRELDEGRP